MGNPEFNGKRFDYWSNEYENQYGVWNNSTNQKHYVDEWQGHTAPNKESAILKAKELNNLIENFIIVTSSHGTFTIHRENLEISLFESAHEEPTNEDIVCITKFDFEEWQKNYNSEIPERVDILDLGYWYNGKSQLEYEEPAHDWRKMVNNF